MSELRMQELAVRLVWRFIRRCEKRKNDEKGYGRTVTGIEKQLGSGINMEEKRDGEWSPVIHNKIVGIVERQIAENNPKESKETLKRLIKLGYDKDEAIEKIGSAVVGEIYNILKFHEKFNERRFVERLHSLK